MSSNSNRERIFADVVSVDAWHQAFDGECSVADLHADVVFQDARVGGDETAPVRFRLRLHRAEVVVVIPATETNLRVLPDSVARDAAPVAVTRHKSVKTTSDVTADAEAGVEVTRSGVSAQAAASGSVAAGRHATETVEMAQHGGNMVVMQSKTPEGQYRWTLTPSLGKHLEGRGWDAASEPRLKVEDRRTDRAKGLPPTLHVEVRCKREDMEIEEIEVKDQARWERIKQQVGFDKRMAAAESYIRSKLASEGLEFGDLSEDFADVTIASIICQPI